MYRLSRLLTGVVTALLLAAGPAVATADPSTGPAPVDSTAATEVPLAAGWLARTLAATGNLALTPDGQTDYASTAYAIMGLRAAGVASGQITASAQAMAASGVTFIGDSTQIGAKTTAIALMILAMSAAGLDPAQYPDGTGVRDLYYGLASAVHSDGSVGDQPSAYGQALVILAFLTSLTNERHPFGATAVPDNVIAWLEAQPCTDQTSPGYGGYGFSTGSCADTDPDSTALAVLALKAVGVPSTTVAVSRNYLLSVQDASGGFVSPFSAANANTTGLALAALNASLGMPVPSTDQEHRAQAAAYLGSLMYGCDLAADPATAPVVGAMAYDQPSRTSNQINPLTPATQTALFQATAQGIWGLVDLMTDPADYTTPATAAVPGAELCVSPSAAPSTAAPATATPTTPVPSDNATPGAPGLPGLSNLLWPWGVVVLAVVIVVFVGGRRMLSGKH